MLVKISNFAHLFLIGQFLLFGFAAILALLALKADLAKARKALVNAQRAVLAAAALSFIILLLAGRCFLADDFSIEMVRAFSSSDLARSYKISALWAGPEGSLLLWSAFVFLIFGLWRVSFRKDDLKFDALSLAIGSAVCGFFSVILVFVTRPFAPATGSIDEGLGLNPLLQNFWMLSHPPILFVGYSIFLIPFVASIAAVFSDRAEITGLYTQLRKWILAGIIFLGLGIATGAKWSYVELGWGGWWAWDPVENASLLPWLVAVAALHCLVGLRYSRKFRFWTILLVPVPFVLCLVATFITRSGVLQSVHSFGGNVIFWVLLLFIILSLVLWISCTIHAAKTVGVALPQLGTPILDRVGLLFWACLVILLFTLAVGVATFLPVISRVFTGSQIVVTRGFYDALASAAGVILAFLVGLSMLAPLTKRLVFRLQLLASTAAGLICYALVFGVLHKSLILALACGVCVFSFSAVIIDLFLNYKPSLLGTHIAHLAFLLLIIAAAFSMTYSSIHIAREKGGKIEVGPYTLKYESFEHKSAEGLTKVGPELALTKADLKTILWPHTTFYPDGKSISEVAVHSGFFEDIYVSFKGVEDESKVILTIQEKPLMTWLWTAFILMAVGLTLTILWDKRAEKKQTVP